MSRSFRAKKPLNRGKCDIFWKYVERILKKLTWMLKPLMLFPSSFKDPADLLGHLTIIYLVSFRVCESTNRVLGKCGP